jgi:hypothetical protein
MNKQKIEAWVLQVIDRVNSKQSFPEDFYVEVKRDWPDDMPKAARQIAGHSNSARGEQILWLIGIDEEMGVVPIRPTEFADWYSRLEAQYDGVAPEIQVLPVPTPAGQIIALLIETDRAPYVVKNPTYGSVAGERARFEVPWRYAHDTRSASRAELLQLLIPIQDLPYCDLISGALKLIESPNEKTGSLDHLWALDVKLFIVPISNERIVISETNVAGSVSFPGHELLTFEKWEITHLNPIDVRQSLEGAVFFDNPIILRLMGDQRKKLESYETGTARIVVSVRPLLAERTITLDKMFRPIKPIPGSIAMWALSGAPLPWEQSSYSRTS